MFGVGRSTLSMEIIVNGEKTDVRGVANVADLIARYQLPPQSILVEHNGAALRRREWSQTALNDCDRIEFIRVVAGG
jgi:sulfur carrier protein